MQVSGNFLLLSLSLFHLNLKRPSISGAKLEGEGGREFTIFVSEDSVPESIDDV